MNFKNFKSVNVNELYKRDEKLKKEEVLTILDWVEKQPHLPKISELQAAAALHSCYYSIEAAKNTLDSYFTVKTLCSDLFGDRNVNMNHMLKVSLDVSLVTILPTLTPEGYTVVFSCLTDTNPDLYHLTSVLKLFDMALMLHLHRTGPTNGLVMVMDMQGGSFGHLTKLNLSVFKKFIYYLQTALPLRLIAVHHINVVSFIDKLMAMTKPFINKDLYEKLIFHTDSTEDLYKYVPKKCLPKDYGGEAESKEILIEKYKQDMFDNVDFFKYEESQVVDETKRAGKPKNEGDLFGFEGSFKKLQVD